MKTSAKGLLITHYTLVDENAYGCNFVLNDESAFLDGIVRRFERVNNFLSIQDEIVKFLEECRYENSDFTFVVGECQYVIFVHHYIISFATID